MPNTVNNIIAKNKIPSHKYLVEGAINTNIINSLRKDNQGSCGAEAFFLGTIRRDEVKEKWVASIEYSAYTAMAEKVFAKIENRIQTQYNIEQIKILHAIGTVAVGEVSMLVLIQSKHRKAAFLALADTVEFIKAYAPVWKKEQYEDGSYSWVNCTQCQHAAKTIGPLN